MKCPNCGEDHTSFPPAPCFVRMFLGILLENGEITRGKAEKILENLNTDLFWEDVHVILDKLERHEYDYTEEQ